MRYANPEMLCHSMRDQIHALDASLRIDTPFLIFETWRSPEQQDNAFARGVSKARAFQSPHQFGLAVDFVPFINGNWTWQQPDAVWEVLHARAATLGLLAPMAWDKGHIESPDWPKIRKILIQKSAL